MSEPIDATNIKDLNSVSAADTSLDLLNQSNSNKNLAQVLLKESTSYHNDSQAKAQQAQDYIKASDYLKKKASAVRVRADQLRQKELSKEERVKVVKEIISMLPDDLKLLVPSNASPEVLDKIADELELRARNFRRKADDLLKDSEESERLSKQLKEQSNLVDKKNLRISDLHLKSASAHSQGLLLVLKKLGIAKLDAEYKAQVASTQGKV